MDMNDRPGQSLLPALLGLRGAAAVAVLLFHLHHLAGLPLPPGCGFIDSHFGLAVQLFFVLSGFSLCHSTLHTVGRENWIRDYLVKRFFRIAPLFYLMLAIWVVFFWLRGVSTDLMTTILNVSFTFNLVPGRHESIVPAGWTIGVEMIFYCLLPVLLSTIRSLPAALVFLAIATAVSGAGRAALVRGGESLAGYAGLSFIASLVVFSAGITAHHAWRALPQGRRTVAFTAAVTLGLAAILASPFQARLLGPSRPDVTLWSLCFAGLVIWQAAAPSRLLSSGLFQFFGNRSYGIYLIHPLAIVLLKDQIQGGHAAGVARLGDWAFLLTGGIVTILVVALASVTYALVEAPGVRAGRRLIERLSGFRPHPTPDPGPLPARIAPRASPRAPTGFQRLITMPASTRVVAALAAAMLGFSAWVTIRAIDQPLVDIHAFRQTQTALTADWMVREGWQLDYQTPVAGAPWAIPFEFPVYQAIVAAVVALTGWDLPATGRVVSWLFLVACAWPAFAVAKRLRLPPAVPWVFCGLLWSAPLYVYWSRTFLIETAALFFTLSTLPWWLDVVRGRSGQSRWLLLACASLAVLQKSTTGGPVLLFLLVSSITRRMVGARLPAQRVGTAWATALVLGALAIGAAWSAHADAVKTANPLGRVLTSSVLSAWNFGSPAQRLDPETWRTVVWQRGFLWNAGGLLGAGMLIAPWAWPRRWSSAAGRHRHRMLMLICLTLFLLPILTFTNLHVVHEYYQVACVAFLLAALAIAIGAWLPRVTGVAAAAPLALMPFLVANVDAYRSHYGIVVGRPLDQQDPLALQRYRLGRWLEDATPRDSGLVVFGQTWSSELPFHARRKACVCPTWLPGIEDVWQHPESVLGGLPLGAIVVSPQAGEFPDSEAIQARLAAGGWRHELVHGSDVLVPAPGAEPLNPGESPTDPGDSTTAPR